MLAQCSRKTGPKHSDSENQSFFSISVIIGSGSCHLHLVYWQALFSLVRFNSRGSIHQDHRAMCVYTSLFYFIVNLGFQFLLDIKSRGALTDLETWSDEIQHYRSSEVVKKAPDTLVVVIKESKYWCKETKYWCKRLKPRQTTSGKADVAVK